MNRSVAGRLTGAQYGPNCVQVDSVRTATLFVDGGDYAQAARRTAVPYYVRNLALASGMGKRVVELGTPKAEAHIVIKRTGI
jgi:hypothetical protein